MGWLVEKSWIRGIQRPPGSALSLLRTPRQPSPPEGGRLGASDASLTRRACPERRLPSNQCHGPSTLRGRQGAACGGPAGEPCPPQGPSASTPGRRGGTRGAAVCARRTRGGPRRARRSGRGGHRSRSSAGARRHNSGQVKRLRQTARAARPILCDRDDGWWRELVCRQRRRPIASADVCSSSRPSASPPACKRRDASPSIARRPFFTGLIKG